MRPQRASTRRGTVLRVEGVNTLPQRVLAARARAKSVLLANISTPREVTRSRTALAVKQACSPPQQEQPHSIRVKRVVPASMRPQRATTKRGTALRVEVVNTLHQRVLAARAFARSVRQILHRQRPAVRCRIANATPDQLVPMGARALRVWRASSKPRAALLCVPRVRRADILRVWAPHQTCVNSAIQAAKLVSIRVVAVQAQGSWSARTALRFRDIIAQPRHRIAARSPQPSRLPPMTCASGGAPHVSAVMARAPTHRRRHALHDRHALYVGVRLGQSCPALTSKPPLHTE
jgi:hypothetical protein